MTARFIADFHDLCKLFPLMGAAEFDELKEDIRANGLREAIWIYQGRIIDGRNRLLACREVGVEPAYREWDGKGSLAAFVVSQNLHRRHLNAGQKAVIAERLQKLLAREARERQRAAGGDRGNQHTKRKQQEQQSASELPLPANLPEAAAEESQPTAEPEPNPRRANESREQAAALTGASPRNVQNVKFVEEHAPELLEDVEAGEMSLHRATQEARRRAAARGGSPEPARPAEPESGQRQQQPPPPNVCRECGRPLD